MKHDTNSSLDAKLKEMNAPREADTVLGVTSLHAKPSAPGPSLPRPIDHTPRLDTGLNGESKPLPASSPLHDVKLSIDTDDDGLSLALIRERATEALTSAEDTLTRSIEVAGKVRDVAAQYEQPLRETRSEVETFTRHNPKMALALAFGAGILVAKALRKFT